MAKPPKTLSRTIQKAPKASQPKAPFVQKLAQKPAPMPTQKATGTGSASPVSSGRPGAANIAPAPGSRASIPNAAARARKSTVGALISRRASDRLRNGHLWVYASDIEALETGPGDPPPLLPVADNRGLLLGTALYSPVSQIALRMVSHQAINEQQWLEILSQRLRVAIDRRKHLLDENTNACRLVFSEADNLPGLVIDKYAGIVVVQLLSKGLDTAQIRQTCATVLSERLGGEPLTIWERPDPRIRELEGLSAPSAAPLFSNSAPISQTLFLLNGLSFHFDVNSGQKTGAFLDQRQNYAAAAAWAQSRGAKRALDVCTYQGGFALHLARVCSHVTGIDASRGSLVVAEHNQESNRQQLKAEVDWVEADAFELLRAWSAKSETGSAAPDLLADHPGDNPGPWDLIVLDPPAFAKSKRAVEGALRGYKELNLRALRMLKPGGLLITCSCSHHVSWTDLEGAVASAALDAQRRVTLLERHGAAEDHPVLLNLPETEYLKCLICQVD